jgi:glutamate synthase (NADPH/NADH)
MLLVDTQEKSFIQDVELKANIAKLRPHGEWLQQQVKYDTY